MSAASPTSRTLALLRKEGWTAAVVERFNPHAKIRQDLFGCIDVLAIHPGEQPLGIQTTTSNNAAARMAKALTLPALRIWLEAGCRFEVWAWGKRGPCGKRKLWNVVRRVVTLTDL